MIWKYIFPFNRLSFHFVDGFLFDAERINLELEEKSRRKTRTTKICNEAVAEGDELE